MPVHWFALLGILLLQWNRDFFALADASSATATVDASGNVHIESTHVAEPSTENILPRVQTPFSDFPDYWQEYTYDDIREYFECEQTQASLDKPLPSMDEWNFMRSVYNSVVDPDKAWDDPVPPTEGYSIKIGRPEPPPYFAKASPGLGRGLFAVSVTRTVKTLKQSHKEFISPTLMRGFVLTVAV